MTSSRRRGRLLALAFAAAFSLAACGDDADPDPGAATPEGEPVSPCATDPDAALDDTYWGMHVASPIDDGFPDAPLGALNLTTSQTYWPSVETAPGRLDFTRLDAIVDTAEERGARPMVVLGFTPEFHADGGGQADPPDPEAWTDYVRAVAQRYGDRLDYQVWPEPNIRGNWTGSPARMADLTVRAGQVIGEVTPDALVVAPATALRLPAQQRWMDRFWGASTEGTTPGDVVALDPFPLEDGTPEDSLALICEAREILDRHGVEAPVWTNEINYGVPSRGNATGVEHLPQEDQAASVARTYLLHRAVGVDRVYWLGWGSYPGMSVAMTEDDGRTPSAGARALETVHGWLAGARPPVCRVDSGVHTCLVERADESWRIVWTEQGAASVPAPEGASRTVTALGAEERLAPGDDVTVGSLPVAIVSTG